MVACSSRARRESAGIKKYQRNYKFVDISGEFLLDFQSGRNKKNEAYVKRRLIGEGDNQEYERLVAVSKLGALENRQRKIIALRPKISQYTVWLDKQKYFSQLEIIPHERVLKVITKSPEKKWNGVENIPFQNSRGIFCFFSQITDCVKVTGFLSQAIQRQAGKMSFTIIWEGYPFIGQQYAGIEGPFATSIFSYEGISEEGNFIFNLNFGGQVLFYHFNQNMELEKKFWVSQGMTQVGI